MAVRDPLLGEVEALPDPGQLVPTSPVRSLVRVILIELGSSRDGGLVDPVTGNGLAEHIEGGLVVFGAT